MRHIHTTLNDNEFKVVKKKVIDLGVDLKDFIHDAVIEKCGRKEEGSEVSNKDVTNDSNQ